MSSVLSSPDMSSPSGSVSSTLPASGRGRLPGWLREPLLHFVILGGVLFAVDAAIFARAEDPNTIVMDASVDAEAKQVFETSRGRPPNEAELKALRQVWLDNEVLYREGLALGLDKGDQAIRERVIFKALSIVDAGTKRPAYDDALLREWFEKNREKYDQPARFDYEEAVLSGDTSEAAVRAFASSLNAGTAPDADAGLRVFKARPHTNLVQSYGEAFATELESMPPGEWRAIRSRDGWRAMRLGAVTPPQPADFERLRGVVLQDWTDATLAEQRSAAVRAIAKKYTIKVEGDAR
jgi:hypothetical protein